MHTDYSPTTDFERMVKEEVYLHSDRNKYYFSSSADTTRQTRGESFWYTKDESYFILHSETIGTIKQYPLKLNDSIITGYDFFFVDPQDWEEKFLLVNRGIKDMTVSKMKYRCYEFLGYAVGDDSLKLSEETFDIYVDKKSGFPVLINGYFSTDNSFHTENLFYHGCICD